MNEPKQGREKIAGCTVSVMRRGEGPTLLFLHGAGGASKWMPFMQSLSEHYDVIVPEHPGFGSSENPEWLDNIHDLAYFYLDFIEALELQNVNLVGASLGGWIAAELAVKNQTSLRSLTMVAAAGIHVPGIAKGDVFLWSDEQLTRNLYFDRAFSDTVLAQVPSDAEKEVLLQNKLTAAKLAWQPRFYDPNLSKWLHRITIPTLILWGAEDRIFPAAYGTVFRDLLPNARLNVFDNCGHLPHMEKPEEFVTALRTFIEAEVRP